MTILVFLGIGGPLTLQRQCLTQQRRNTGTNYGLRVALTHREASSLADIVGPEWTDNVAVAPRFTKNTSPIVQRAAKFGTRPWTFAADLFAVSAPLLLLGQGLVATIVLVTLYLLFASAASLYRSQLAPSVLDDSPLILGRLLIAATITYVLSPQATATLSHLGDGFGRAWWLAVCVSGLALLCGRAIVYSAVRHARRRHMVGHRTLIVGAGEVGTELASQLIECPAYGLRPVAFYDPEPVGGIDHSLPIFRSGSLAEAINRTQAKTVVIAFASLRESQMIEFLHESHKDHAEIFFVPRLFEVASLAGRDLERVGALPVQRLKRAAHRSALWRVKGLLDRSAALVALVLLAPLLLVISVAVLVSLGRPLIFHQIRIGLDGREFGILKFRTLTNTDAQSSDTAWSSENTDRKPTRVGSFLRATSLDELPQLINIVRGDMSFVGPRPERPHFAGEFAGRHRHYNSRHRVPTGLTGLAQVNGLRGDTSISERTRFDNVYVETWSLWGDAKIILRTVRLLIPKRNP